MTDRPTPRVDRWKRATTKALDKLGAGSRAALARYLTAGYGSTEARWKVQIAKVLNGQQVPDGEFLLAVDAFLHK